MTLGTYLFLAIQSTPQKSDANSVLLFVEIIQYFQTKN